MTFCSLYVTGKKNNNDYLNLTRSILCFIFNPFSEHFFFSLMLYFEQHMCQLFCQFVSPSVLSVWFSFLFCFVFFLFAKEVSLQDGFFFQYIVLITVSRITELFDFNIFNFFFLSSILFSLPSCPNQSKRPKMYQILLCRAI